MAVDHLPAQVREFANYLDGLLARLDQGSGWCAVFWQRDPDGMRACLDAREVPPWDVVEALLQDLAAEYGTPVAARDADRARPLHAAALAAHDARPGGRDALGDRLDVMLREQRHAVERQAELGRLLAAATTQAEADALRLDLAWAHDDHERATARCAEITHRLAELDRRPPTEPQPQGARLIRPRAGGSGRGTAGAAYQGGGAATDPRYGRATTPAEPGYDHVSGYDHAGGPADPGPGYDGAAGYAPAGASADPGRYDRAAGYAPAGASAGPGHRAPAPAGPGYDGAAGYAPAGASADPGHRAPAPAGPGYDGAAGYAPAGASADSGHRAPASADAGHAPQRGYTPEGGYGTQSSHAEPAPVPAADAPVAPAPEPDPTPVPAEGAPLPKQRKRRRGGARFAGMGEAEGAGPVVVPPVAEPVAPAPVTASRRTLRGARFAGAAAETQQAAPAEPAADGERSAGPGTVEAVERLVRLRGEGRSGEAHALLVELAYWPAARIPLLAAGLQRAGLNADWATLLWEAASLPADRLVAVADALTEAGRTADGEQVLRQGVVRSAEEIGKAAAALTAQGRRREVSALLDAFVRVRTPEDVALGAEPEPHVLVPLLLEAARGVSKDRHRDLVHALRVAGHPT
ncbi:hypothetical protein [Streptomyces sp. NPDC002328]|uniref:hypothetical protein n=1 Tax=Streptomyces sp. NPDC002328 TaxID=3364642 RepID=UPI0036AEF15F